MSDSGTRPNPFATRYVRPGAMPFVFPPGESTGNLLERLCANGGVGQIIGPHGTGKSTLLATLIAELKLSGWSIVHFVLHTGDRWLPFGWRRQCNARRRLCIIVDGYEQLNSWNQRRLVRYCRRFAFRFLVTGHEPTGLPILYRTEVRSETAIQIGRFLQNGLQLRLDDSEVVGRLAAHGGNFREALFDLYDIYERRRRAAPQLDRRVASDRSHCLVSTGVTQ